MCIFYSQAGGVISNQEIRKRHDGRVVFFFEVSVTYDTIYRENSSLLISRRETHAAMV